MKQLAILTVALACGLPLAAKAAPEAVVTTVGVRHGDLDLSRGADAAAMLERLDRAATRACGASRFSAPDVKAATRASACYRDAVDQTVASLASPELTAAYRARSRMYVAAR